MANLDLDDCRTGRDYVRWAEQQDALVQRNGGSTAYVISADGAVKIHEDDKTLGKGDRKRLAAALTAVLGLAGLVLALSGALHPILHGLGLG